MSDSYLSVSIDEAHELCRAALIEVGVAEEHAKNRRRRPGTK